MKIKISPDKEKAKSILNMVKQREDYLIKIKKLKFTTLISETYYEIIKELVTALQLIEGFKFIGKNAHKELLESLISFKKFKTWEIELIDDLRIRRNKSSYEGKQFPEEYLKNKETNILLVIDKLKSILEPKI